MSTLLSFPLKDSYEKTNTTLDGLMDKDQRRGDPEIPSIADECEPESPIDDRDELDDGNDGDDGQDGGGAGKVSKSGKASEPILPPPVLVMGRSV